MKSLLPWAALAAVLAFAPANAETPAPAATSAPTATPVEAVSAIPPPPEGKGQVVFFRSHSLGGAPYAFTIKDGDQPVTKLGVGRYFVYVTDPGDHQFKVRAEAKDELYIEVDPGETYYVEQHMVMGMFYYANLAPSSESAFNAMKLKPAPAAH